MSFERYQGRHIQADGRLSRQSLDRLDEFAGTFGARRIRAAGVLVVGVMLTALVGTPLLAAGVLLSRAGLGLPLGALLCAAVTVPVVVSAVDGVRTLRGLLSIKPTEPGDAPDGTPQT